MDDSSGHNFDNINSTMYVFRVVFLIFCFISKRNVLNKMDLCKFFMKKYNLADQRNINLKIYVINSVEEVYFEMKKSIYSES